ncbi:MAG: GNAT family N-acetyltransferase [Eubacteriales bacterium]
MEISVRKAESRDIPKLSELLSEVLELHAKIRPDIFISGSTKYTASELADILANDKTPVFVAVDENDTVRGYVFCQIKRQPFSTNMKDFKTLFIDDLCIDESCRGAHIGTKLFDFALGYAKEEGCYDLTLNVWEGNDGARAFYEKMGMFVKETQMEILVK